MSGEYVTEVLTGLSGHFSPRVASTCGDTRIMSMSRLFSVPGGDWAEEGVAEEGVVSSFFIRASREAIFGGTRQGADGVIRF